MVGISNITFADGITYSMVKSTEEAIEFLANAGLTEKDEFTGTYHGDGKVGKIDCSTGLGNIKVSFWYPHEKLEAQKLKDELKHEYRSSEILRSYTVSK